VALTVISLIISLGAFLLSLRQFRVSSLSRPMPVVLNAFRESRDPEWFAAQEYVLTRLAVEFPEPVDVRGLPPRARAQVSAVGQFYDDLGKLVAHRMISQDLVIGAYGGAVTPLWDAVAPYVTGERTRYGLDYWVYFEDLAVRAEARPPRVVYARLRLRKRGPGG
jgi:hypothetical protein